MNAGINGKNALTERTGKTHLIRCFRVSLREEVAPKLKQEAAKKLCPPDKEAEEIASAEACD